MKKIDTIEDTIEFYIYDNGEYSTESGFVKLNNEGKIIIPNPNCYAFKINSEAVKKEKKLVNRLTKILGKNCFKVENVLHEPVIYFIGEYLDKEQIKERFGEGSNTYGNAVNKYFYALAITEVGGLTFPIFDDFRKVLSPKEVAYENVNSTLVD